MIARRILREPLLHFLVAGGVLFAAYRITHTATTDASSDRTIAVDDHALLTFMQYQAKAFQNEYFETQLAALRPEERKALEDQYLQDEMLYREAKALGLEQGDDVIRQRLIQKMRFLMDDLGETGDRPTDAVLRSYLEKNSARFLLEPSVTFTHVFVDASVHGNALARQRAERLKAALNAGHAGFNDAPRFGDRFPFLQNYVDRTFDYVSSHFGEEFAASVKTLEPSDTAWQGPIRSTYGYHLVLVTHRTEARLPDLAEIRQQVEDDWMRDRAESVRSQSMVRLAAQYTVEHKSPRVETSR
jgi:hypothetical protein